MTNLKNVANCEAQDALRAVNDYVIKHGKRNALLDEVYTAAERVVDAVEEYERLLAHSTRPVQRDRGDHFIRTDPCDIDGDEHCRTHGGRFDGKDYRRCSKAPVAA